MGRSDPLPTDALVGVHVLVVDDDDDARQLMRTILQYCGALVTTVGSARDAIRTMERVTPDVVLSDIAMPDEDGYWLVGQMRALPPARGGAIPAIALTAHGHPHGPDRTLAAGFQAHLRKPIDPWELCRTIVGVVRNRSERAQAARRCARRPRPACRPSARLLSRAFARLTARSGRLDVTGARSMMLISTSRPSTARPARSRDRS